MNEFQTQLYKDLMHLCSSTDAFYFQDYEKCGRTFRIFNYRLASYSDFMLPNALECRGHMFEVDGEGNAIRLACLPQQKFFNLYENPMVMGLDLSKTDLIMDKADGSLISTFEINSELHFKSKGSLYSEQAQDAMAWVKRPENRNLYALRVFYTCVGYTVNMEWCSPKNRIVLPYQHEHLQVLNIRSMSDGELNVNLPTQLATFGVKVIQVDDPVTFIKNVPQMVGVEGVIARIDGVFVKVKTGEYLKLHHCKDNVNNPRRLFEAVVLETADDLRSLFYDDPYAIGLIDDMQTKVSAIYNDIVSSVESFYDENHELDRKSYAIKGQAELPQMMFGLAMNKFLQKPIDYKQFMISKWKEFGLKDEKVDVE